MSSQATVRLWGTDIGYVSLNEERSGQVAAALGFEYWLMKFDGVKKNRDKELVDPEGYGAIEYAYSKMAKDAGVSMMPCRLFEENGRRHFMTKRFDRTDDGVKLHMQSLAAMAHYDFNMAGAYGYEQAIMTIKQLGLGMPMKWVSITITAIKTSRCSDSIRSDETQRT